MSVDPVVVNPSPYDPYNPDAPQDSFILPGTNDLLTRTLMEIAARIPRYQQYTHYYDGRHTLSFATQKFRTTFGALFHEFADNLCPAVCDALADKLQIEGLSTDDDDAKGGKGSAPSPQDTAAQDALDELWERNRMTRRVGEVHLEALRAGDSYVIVWPDANGQPVIYPQKAGGITVHYDDEQVGVIDFAAKVWITFDRFVRMNLYYPDRIEKYVTSEPHPGGLPAAGNMFVPYFPLPAEPWPLPNPYGRVPIWHFANNASVGEMGRSELRDVIPLQNALNKAILDMLVAMEYHALPQRWVTGIEPDVGDDGVPRLPFKPGADQVWFTESDVARFGQFEHAPMEQLLSVQRDFRAEIARVSRTPLHYFLLQSGQFPSGEALREVSAPFLGKVLDRQTAFGDTWADCMAFALEIALGRPVELLTKWKDPAPRGELEHAQTLQIKVGSLGVSKQQAQREMNYTDEDIETMAQEKQDEQATMQQLGSQLMNAFDKGQPGLPPGSGSKAGAG